MRQLKFKRRYGAEVLAFGPKRVVVDKEGTTAPPKHAVDDHKILPDIIFFRADGWSVGAPYKYAAIAHELWADSFVAYAEVQPISKYRRKGRPARKKSNRKGT